MDWEDKRGTYVVIARFMDDNGWQRKVNELTNATYREADYFAQSSARELDRRYGDSHFWTVDIKDSIGQPYYQYFHGRTL